MSGYADTIKNAILDAGFGGAPFESKDPHYLALCTAAVVGADTGATIAEPAFTPYARLEMKSGDWSAAAAGAKHNVTLMKFAECTAGEGSVKYWALCTTLAKGTGLVVASGVTPITAVAAGITPQFAIGDLIYKLLDT